MATSTVAMTTAMARYLVAFAAVFSAVTADKPTTGPLATVPGYYQSSSMTLSLSPSEDGPVTYIYPVAPLTAGSGLNATNPTQYATYHVEGKIALVDQTNYNLVNDSSTIVYMSCDSNTANSFITPSDMLDVLMTTSSVKPKAILLYSTAESTCELGGNNLSYTSVWTMLSSEEAWMARNQTDEATGTMAATITGNGTSGSSDLDGDGSGGNNSAVAMSILYSITGLITLLFLIIIGTGAVRAHRHPERYGPRAGYGGRSRQSRARGLARAMLETLPIVKFGDPQPQPAKGDPEQELESVSGDARPETAPRTAASGTTDQASRGAKTGNGNGTINHTMSGAVAAQEQQAANPGGNTEDETLGCSICTDDFTVGEDVRVLPCNHKFHPPCIDPWLVNVSGTCPLCRLDLRPQGSKGEEGASSAELVNSGGASLMEESNESASEVARRRRRSFLDWNRLRHASVDERIQALRQFREQQDDSTGDGSPEERNRRARFAERLKEKFHIRTRTQSAGNNGRESPPAS